MNHQAINPEQPINQKIDLKINSFVSSLRLTVGNARRPTNFNNKIVQSLLDFQLRHSKLPSKRKNGHYKHVQKATKQIKNKFLETENLPLKQFCKNHMKVNKYCLPKCGLLIFMINLVQTYSREKAFNFPKAACLFQQALRKSDMQFEYWFSNRQTYTKLNKKMKQNEQKKLDSIRQFFKQAYSLPIQYQQQLNQLDQQVSSVKFFIKNYFKINFFQEVSSRIQLIKLTKGNFQQKFLTYKKQICQFCNSFWSKIVKKSQENTKQLKIVQVEDFSSIQWRFLPQKIKQNQQNLNIRNYGECLNYLKNYLSKLEVNIQFNQQVIKVIQGLIERQSEEIESIKSQAQIMLQIKQSLKEDKLIKQLIGKEIQQESEKQIFAGFQSKRE